MQVAAESLSATEASETRFFLNRVILAWAFGAVFVQLSTGAVYASFARQLGASEGTFGFLAGVSPLMGCVQLFAARMLEGRVPARTLMLSAGLSSRALWVFAASLPWLHYLAPGVIRREWMLPMFVGCVVLASIGQAFISPSFFTWMSGLVPPRIGPSFWARRFQIGTFAGIGAVLLGGWVADRAGWIKEATNGEIPPLLVYSALLMIAGAFGVADIAAFWKLRDTPREPQPLPPLWESLKAPLRERAVRNYLRFTVTAMIGFATSGPLLWLFCLEWLEWDTVRTGFLLTICPLAGMAVSSKMWGAVAKNYGTRPMLRFASMGQMLVPVCWLLALPSSTVPLAFMLFASGIFFAPYEISNVNFITRACPHLPRPTLTAVFWICAGTTFALTSWGAGEIVENLSGFRREWQGLTFTNYHLMFAFSLLPRALNAFVWAPRLDEPDATATREAVNEVGAQLSQSLVARFTRFGARGE